MLLTTHICIVVNRTRLDLSCPITISLHRTGFFVLVYWCIDVLVFFGRMLLICIVVLIGQGMDLSGPITISPDRSGVFFLQDLNIFGRLWLSLLEDHPLGLFTCPAGMTPDHNLYAKWQFSRVLD